MQLTLLLLVYTKELLAEARLGSPRLHGATQKDRRTVANVSFIDDNRGAFRPREELSVAPKAGEENCGDEAEEESLAAAVAETHGNYGPRRQREGWRRQPA